MDAPAAPVALADVTEQAVRVIKRTLLRHRDQLLADPMDDYLARVIVERLTMVLHQPGETEITPSPTL